MYGLAHGSLILPTPHLRASRPAGNCPLQDRGSTLKQFRLDGRVQRDRRRNLRAFILRIVQLRAYRIAAHLSCVVWLEKVPNCVKVRDIGIKPDFVLVWRHDHRHSVVHVSYERIGRCCQDRATLDDFSLGTFPLIPQARECKQISFAHFKTIGLLHASHRPPFVETISRDEAPFGQDRISERRRRRDRFRPSIERLIADLHVRRPRRDETPTHCCKLASFFALFSAHSQDRLRRRDVVSRAVLDFIPCLKPLRQIAL